MLQTLFEWKKHEEAMSDEHPQFAYRRVAVVHFTDQE